MASLCLYTPDVGEVPGIHQVVLSARRACAPAMSPRESAAKKAITSCVLSVTSIVYLPHLGGSRYLCTGETIAGGLVALRRWCLCVFCPTSQFFQRGGTDQFCMS